MPERPRHRSRELVPVRDVEENQRVSGEVDIDPLSLAAEPSRREPHEDEDLQVVVRTHRGGNTSQREQQSSQPGSVNLRDDRLRAADGQVPQGLALGVARRFDITHKLARDGIDSMYMEDVTRLGWFERPDS